MTNRDLTFPFLSRRLAALLQPGSGGINRLRRSCLRSGGKQMRGSLVLILGDLFSVPRRTSVALAAAVEAVHLASLIHDDIIDGGRYRRRQPSLHRACGLPAAVLYGDIVFARAMQTVNDLGCAQVTDLLLGTVHSLCRGEILENALRRRFPWKRAAYFRIVDLKTAALFQFCSQAPAVLAGMGKRKVAALNRFGRNLGRSFQIADDCLDLLPGGGFAEKDRLMDLKNGIPSLPLILAGSDPAVRKEIRRAMGPKPSGSLLPRLASQIQRDGFLDRASGYAERYLGRARQDAGRIMGWGKRGAGERLMWYLDGHSQRLRQMLSS